MKKFAAVIISLLFFSMTSVGLLSIQTSPVAAQKEAACEALGGDCGVSDGNSVYSILKTVLNILSIVAGAAAVIMIIISGLKFITSQGDSGAVSGARNTVLYAVIGIIVVVMSQIIVQFVLSETNAATQASPVDNSYTNKIFLG